MAMQNGILKSPIGSSFFRTILVASCLLSGVMRADDTGTVEQLEFREWTKQIDFKKVPYDELEFYRALKWDGEVLLDSRVHTSSLESDAEMLLAIQQGDFDSVKDVLEHGVEPSVFDPDRLRHSPTYWAVYYNRPEMVKLLLDRMAEGWMGSKTKNESALQLAQKIHPEMVSILRTGMKRNREILAKELTDNLHANRIDVPAFSNTSFRDLTDFLVGAMNRANVGYLERSVGIACLTAGPDRYPPPINTPAMHNVSLWDALQAIADADHLKFVVSEETVTFFSPSVKKPYWDP
jgi:ankyrin repeat protein